MISILELRRILADWRTRFQRIQAILSPPAWTETDWKKFGRALAGLLQRYGATWTVAPRTYWDLRWNLRDGGELICQAESLPGEKLSLVVAQTGGFVQEVESYTWFWAEFDPDGEFIRDPYWVEGTWKEALTALLLPYQYQAGYYLAGSAPTPPSLMLGNTASHEPEPAGTHAHEMKETAHATAFDNEPLAAAIHASPLLDPVPAAEDAKQK
ncbi:MAG: hypothetical protein HY360_13105 [Verrucomicrobia bacterium]|nr:hypothetical protein [Verrucomicrobiota bacterium]